MKVLVCGGRDFTDRDLLFDTLDSIHEVDTISQIIEGYAKGTDALAREWAILNKIPNRSFPADWQLHKERAGPIRNKQMLEQGKPDLVLAFPGGKGTANMMKQARDSRNANLRIIEVAYS